MGKRKDRRDKLIVYLEEKFRDKFGYEMSEFAQNYEKMEQIKNEAKLEQKRLKELQKQLKV